MRDVSFRRVQSYLRVIIDAGRQELEGRVGMARTVHQAAVGLSSDDVGGSCRDSPGRLTNGGGTAAELLDLGLSRGLADKTGNHLAFAGTPLGNGRERSREALLENAELQSTLRQTILASGPVRPGRRGEAVS